MTKLTFTLMIVPLLFGQLASPQQDQTGQRIDFSREMIQPIGRIEVAKHPLVLDPPIGPQSQKLDPAKLRQEADELCKLAQSVPVDIDQVTQGKLPKDMADKLRRIEKLSKHLRSELTP